MYPLSALPYSFRHALQRIKRKTHERTRARESSCCVRPLRRMKKRAVRRRARTRRCVRRCRRSHKGTFRDRRLLIRRRFRKGLFCSRWSRGARAPVAYTRFSQSPREHPDRFTSDCATLLIDRNFISITSYFDRSQAGSLDPRRPQISLAFPRKRTKIDVFQVSLFIYIRVW